jgi:hypothetical protein
VRALLIGGGGPGLRLARELVEDGHAVRFVTREESNRAAVEATGAECWIGDPDVIGTLRYALDNVTVLLWLLGPVREAALHGPRLQMMLERTTDTTVRGVVYECGTDAGLAELRSARERNEIPYRVVEEPRDDVERWIASVRGAIDSLLVPREARLAERT